MYDNNIILSSYLFYNLHAFESSLYTYTYTFRFDSLSKFVAPGMRLGWVSGPTDFIDKYQLLQELTSQFPSGVSQSAFLGLVRTWGKEGFHAHLEQVSEGEMHLIVFEAT
jgi:DNA-binding transcriptional MocR family regulator